MDPLWKAREQERGKELPTKTEGAISNQTETD
jgi:hypothetical protein